MSDKIELQIGASGDNFLKQLQDMRAELVALKDANNDLNKSIKNTMEGGAASEAKYSKELADNIKKLEEQKLLISEMKKQLDLYEKSSDKAFSGKEAEEYKKKIKDLEAELKKVRKELDNTGEAGKKGFKKTGDEVENAERKTNKFASSIKGAFKLLAAFFAVDQIIRFGRALLDITAKFGAYEAVLTNALGSRSAARQGMADILLFATKTPFQVDQITESYIKLVNRGFVPTLKELRQIGDLASSQGKSLDQLVEAILDAQTGEYERLKEFGILARSENDKLTLSFKGQTQTVEKNSAAIRNAILSFGDLQGVAGGMASVSSELTGKMSNFSDIMSQIFGGLGKKNSGIMSNAIDLFTRFASGVKEYFDINTEAQLRTEQSEINALSVAIFGASENQVLRNNNVQILMNKYPEFFRGLDREKVTNEEIAARLLVVNRQYERRIELAQKQAIATKAEEQFGKVLSDNAEAVSSIIKLAQKYNIEVSNIDFTKASDVFKLGEQLSTALSNDNFDNGTFFGKLQKLFNGEIGTVSELNKAINQIVNSTDAATQANLLYQDAVSSVNKEQAEANKINEEAIKSLKAKNAQIILDKKNLKISAEDAAKQMAANDAEIERITSGLLDLSTLFEKVTDSKTATKQSQEVINAAISRVKKIAELETQLANTRVELMTEGVYKERLLENTRYENTVRQLKAEQFEIEKKYGTQSKEYQLLNDTLEAENRVHTAKMLVIETKYNEERQKAYKDAQKSIDDANLSARQLEIKSSTERFAAQLKDLDKSAPNFFPTAPAGTPLYEQQLKDIGQFLTIRQNLIAAGRENEVEINNKFDSIALEQERDLAIQSIDALKVSGAHEAKLTELKEALKGKIVQEYGEKRINQILKQSGIEQSVTKQQIDKYQDYLLTAVSAGKIPTDLLTFLNIDLSEIPEEKKQEVRAYIQQLVNEIKESSEKTATGFKEFDSFGGLVGQLLGLSNNETDQLVQAYQKIEDAITSGIQNNIALRQNEINVLSTQIDDLESELDRELSLREKGYANNVEAKRLEIQALRSQRNQELAEQRKYQKELQKIEAAKQAAAFASSVANLIQTSSKILQSQTEQFGWVGAITGLVTIAGVIAEFLVLKNKIQAIKYAGGGEVDGLSHAQGGNKYVSMDGNDARIIEIEKGEYLVNKKSTDKYKDLIEAINKDELSAWSYDDMMRFVSPNEIQPKRTIAKRIVAIKEGSVSDSINNPSSSLEKNIEVIAVTNTKILENSTKSVVENDKQIIIREPNYVRIINKS